EPGTKVLVVAAERGGPSLAQGIEPGGSAVAFPAKLAMLLEGRLELGAYPRGRRVAFPHAGGRLLDHPVMACDLLAQGRRLGVFDTDRELGAFALEPFQAHAKRGVLILLLIDHRLLHLEFARGRRGLAMEAVPLLLEAGELALPFAEG